MADQNDFTAEQAAEIEGLPLHEALGKVLGKEFPDTPAAVKSARDTFKFVGESGEARKALQTVMETKGFKTPKEAVDFVLAALEPARAIEQKPEEKKPDIDTSQFVSRSEFDKQSFYGAHPELKGHEKLVETYVKANPQASRDDILKMDDFKEAFGALAVVRQKSILHSDSKIGVAQGNMEKAREKMADGKPVDIEEAKSLATRAVMEAYDL